MSAIAATLAVVVLVRTFAIQVYGISTPSMGATLRPGDYVITSGLPFGIPVPGTRATTPRFRDPRHGDVVVYGEKPGDPPVRIIKRVIGLPGDTIRMAGRTVIRNGTALHEPYASAPSRDDEPLAFEGPYGVAWHLAALPAGVPAESYRPTRDSWGPLVVPSGHYLLLGDDRDGSRDSRVTGFVSREQIRGRVYAIYYSVAPRRASFPRALTAARWSRIGQRVR
ncbi:MAG TPA: signal peptidase I [Longimicrobium sp.]|nr:signal peptidase I [Longimicrobium sp.]